VFVAANFIMLRMLNRYRDDLDVEALPQELSSAADETVAFLKDKAARVSIQNVEINSGRVRADVTVENLGGHKLPTAFPSHRCWLHVTVRDSNDQVLFESGALRPDGSIVGNDNDADPAKYEPHYREITSSEQVEIYETILGDVDGKVTTGLLNAVGYLKDNRLLPHGFNKKTENKNIQVFGDAATDEAFTGAGHTVRYSVPAGAVRGPVRVEAELWYQPIGFRWANNLKPYSSSPEPRRFTRFYDSLTQESGQILARAAITR
jgi:hypothetical protein